jgi:hypothetical protein
VNHNDCENSKPELPGIIISNLADPIKLTEIEINGIAAEAVLPSSMVKVWTRLTLTSDDPAFHRVVSNLELVIAHYAKLSGFLVNLNHSNSVLLVIHADNSADLWIDSAAVCIKALAKRDMHAGALVFADDIADVTALAFPCVEIASKDRIIYLFRQNWRFGLFFDFNPDGSLSVEDTQKTLGTLFRRLRYHHLYDRVRDQAFIGRLIRTGWFPFAEIIGSDFEILANPCEAGFELGDAEDNLLRKFDDERLDRMFRRWINKPHFKTKERILKSGIEAFKRKDPVAVLKIILTEIEGVFSEAHRAATGRGARWKTALEFALKSAEQKAGVPDSLFFPSEFGVYMREYTFADFDPTSGVILSSSRHAVGHGAADERSYSLARALQALLTLDQLAFYS